MRQWLDSTSDEQKQAAETQWRTRRVPVVLRSGLQYVDSEGQIVTVRRHSFDNNFTATRYNGAAFSVNAFGQALGIAGCDIMRPVYSVGMRYARANGTACTITQLSGGTLFPMGDTDNHLCWTAAGGYWSDQPSPSDLLDYAADIKDNEDMSTLPERVRVKFIGDDLDAHGAAGVVFTGTAVPAALEAGGYVAVEVDELPDGALMPLGRWNCDGQVQSGRGWYVRRDRIEVVPDGYSQPKPDAEADMPDAERRLALLSAASGTPLLPSADLDVLWSLWLTGQGLTTDYPSWSMDQLIEARRKLRDACEWTE